MEDNQWACVGKLFLCAMHPKIHRSEGEKMSLFLSVNVAGCITWNLLMVSVGVCLNVQGTLPFRKSESMPEYAIPPHIPRRVLNEGRRLRISWRSFQTQEERKEESYDDMSAAGASFSDSDVFVSAEDDGCTAAYAASAASMPLFMALCVPFILATFINPAEQPISAPPGKLRIGTDWRPPSVRTRAP